MKLHILKKGNDGSEPRAFIRRVAKLVLGCVLLKVKDVMVTDSVVVDANTSVREAVKRMNDFGIGCQPVMDSGKVAGIMSERDILRRVVAEGKNPCMHFFLCGCFWFCYYSFRICLFSNIFLQAGLSSCLFCRFSLTL